MVIIFKNSIYASGSPLESLGKEWQLIPNNTMFAPFLQHCEPKPAMNAYICKRPYLGMLRWESEDPDKMDRTMSPIYVGWHGSKMANKINSPFFVDWWKKPSVYVAILDAEPGNNVYNLTYVGTPAKK